MIYVGVLLAVVSPNEFYSDVNKTKFLRPRPPEVSKGTWRI